MELICRIPMASFNHLSLRELDRLRELERKEIVAGLNMGEMGWLTRYTARRPPGSRHLYEPPEDVTA